MPFEVALSDSDSDSDSVCAPLSFAQEEEEQASSSSSTGAEAATEQEEKKEEAADNVLPFPRRSALLAAKGVHFC